MYHRTYAKTRRDAEYLESLAQVEDWVEIDAMVQDLMQNPSKTMAAGMYGSVIGLWFDEHHRSDHMKNPKVRKICREHGHEFYLQDIPEGE